MYKYNLVKSLISNGFPNSSIKLRKLDLSKENIFLLDDSSKYIENKNKCMRDNSSKYFQVNDNIENIDDILHSGITFLEKHLEKQNILSTDNNPISNNINIFNNLAKIVPEDVVIHSILPDGSDQVAVVHLCAPNGWSAEDAIGKSFQDIHSNLTNRTGRKLIPSNVSFVKGLTRSRESYERVGAISLRCQEVINRHPSDWSGEEWDNATLLLRFERQTITGLPEVNSFIFTIRTYFVDLLSDELFPLTIKAFENFNEESYTGYVKQREEIWDNIWKKLRKNQKL